MHNVLMGLLFAAVVANAVIRIMEDRRYMKEMLALKKETALVRRMLIIWANQWDSPPDVIKAHLQAAIVEDAKR